jgi:hypothetical protein
VIERSPSTCCSKGFKKTDGNPQSLGGLRDKKMGWWRHKFLEVPRNLSRRNHETEEKGTDPGYIF